MQPRKEGVGDAWAWKSVGSLGTGCVLPSRPVLTVTRCCRVCEIFSVFTCWAKSVDLRCPPSFVQVVDAPSSKWHNKSGKSACVYVFAATVTLTFGKASEGVAYPHLFCARTLNTCPPRDGVMLSQKWCFDRGRGGCRSVFFYRLI